MHARIKRSTLIYLAILALMAIPVVAGASPVGEWDLTIDAQGQPTPVTMTITEEGGELAGLIDSDQGTAELSKVVYDAGALTFILEIVEMGMTMEFEGTINGDAIEGLLLMPDMGMEMATTGTRGGAAPAIVGAWKLMVESQLGNNPRDLVVNDDLSGTYGGGDFDAFDISNLSVEGDAVEFDVTLSVQGQDLPSHVSLTLNGDKVEGELDYGEGTAAIVGARAGGGGLVGTWSMAGESADTGAIERTWTFNDDNTGTYEGDIGSFAISNVVVEGNAVTFDVTLEVQGQELPSTFEGTLDGGVLAGDLNYGAGTATMSGEKK